MDLIRCSLERHGAAILGILNDAIVNSTALYDYVPRPPESMVAWFAAKEAGGYPVLGAVDEAGALMGFASYGPFRAWPAYKYTAEHSVYVHREHRRQGVAEVLMRSLIELAGEQQYHCLVGGIDVSNAASIALHEKLGFVYAGTVRHAGFKFGRWLDLGFWQLLLDTPRDPRDG
ncbi:MAG: N-acetyltransferase family protein [Chloroflexota bacterium]